MITPPNPSGVGIGRLTNTEIRRNCPLLTFTAGERIAAAGSRGTAAACRSAADLAGSTVILSSRRRCFLAPCSGRDLDDRMPVVLVALRWSSPPS